MVGVLAITRPQIQLLALTFLSWGAKTSLNCQVAIYFVIIIGEVACEQCLLDNVNNRVSVILLRYIYSSPHEAIYIVTLQRQNKKNIE